MIRATVSSCAFLFLLAAGADAQLVSKSRTESSGFLVWNKSEVTKVNPANGHIYHLLKYESSWIQAEAFAKSLGGHLASIEDQAEDLWVYNNLTNGGHYKLDYWVGLNDVKTEGNFEWSSGEPVTYVNWGPGEPNNYLGFGPEGEDFCAIFGLNGYAPFTWNDFSDKDTVYPLPIHGVAEVDPAGLQLGDAEAISVSAGGSTFLPVAVGNEWAHADFVMLGSLSGTTPGVTIDGVELPLNVDPYLVYTWAFPGAAPLYNAVGKLDERGDALPWFELAPTSDASLVGLKIAYSAAVFEKDPARSGQVGTTSWPWKIQLVP